MPEAEYSPNLSAYFARIGCAPDPTLDGLRQILQHHVLAITFENIDVHLSTRREVNVDPDYIERKIVGEGRGGYCFEQNTLLYHVLRCLGYDIHRLGARVLYQVPDGVDTGLVHLCLCVTIDGKRWLVDGSFGGMTATIPLEISSIEEVSSPYASIRRLTYDGDLTFHEVKLRDTWTKLYSFSMTPFTAQDVRVSNWFTSTCKECICVNVLMLARITREARYAFLNNTMNIYKHHSGEHESKTVETPEELLELLKEYFNITLPAGSIIGDPTTPFPKSA